MCCFDLTFGLLVLCVAGLEGDDFSASREGIGTVLACMLRVVWSHCRSHGTPCIVLDSVEIGMV